MNITLEWQRSPRQQEADDCGAQFLLYGGAKGGGKSFWLCRWAVKQLAKFRGNKGFLGRKRSVDFTNTTLETFKKAIDPRLYRINEQKKKIYFPCFDGTIDYGGLDNTEEVEKFNSAEYGFFGIDQAEEVPRDAFAMLRGTLRHRLPDGNEPNYFVRLTANPAQCWLKDDFIVQPKEGFKFIQALPSDNPFLASGYVENLREAFGHREDLLQAYLFGSWDDLSGADLCCQVSWVRDAKKLRTYGPVLKTVVVCDPARFGDDETVIYVMQMRNIAEVVDTEIVSHKSTMDTAGRLVAKRKAWGASAIAVDGIGIGAGIVDSLKEMGEEVMDIVSSRKPTMETEAEKYFNLRSQMWLHGAKQIFEQKCLIPDDDILAGQLCSPKFEFMSNGKMKVEGKEDIKERLGRSPDRADAFLMGLLCLGNAPSSKEKEDFESSRDRAGYGNRVKEDFEELTPFPDYEFEVA